MTTGRLVKSGLFAAVMLTLMVVNIGDVALGQAAADADKRVVTTLSIAEVRALLEGEGYKIEKVDSDGDIMFLMDGRKVYWIFYGDDNSSVQLRWAWHREGTGATMERINEWNRTRRYSKAYMDHEGDPTLELDLDLAGGVTMARVKDFLRTGQISATAFVGTVLLNK